MVELQTPSRPGVSVVMPAYNASRFVGRAIESLLAQDDPDFELIVMDDGSTDDTREVARAYAAADSRIRVVTGPNGGVSRATNRGIADARAEWVAIQHADDLAMPSRLRRLRAAAAAAPEVVAWSSYAYHINEAGERLGLSETGPTSRKAFEERLSAGELVGNVIVSAAFFRKRDAEAVGGFDPQIIGAEDLEFFERMAELGPVLALPEPLLERRIHAAAVTVRSFSEMQHATRFIMERRRAWSAGRKAPTYEAFRDAYEQRPWAARTRDRVQELAQFLYHGAAVDYGSGQFGRATARFASSALLWPGYAAPRVWRQLSGARSAGGGEGEVAPSSLRAVAQALFSRVRQGRKQPEALPVRP